MISIQAFLYHSFKFSVSLEKFVIKKLKKLYLYAALKILCEDKHYLFISFFQLNILLGTFAYCIIVSLKKYYFVLPCCLPRKTSHMINLQPTMAKVTAGLVFIGSFVHSLRRSFITVYFLFSSMCSFTVPLKFLLMADIAFNIFLGCLFFHPPLNDRIVWADTDSSVLIMKAAKNRRKKVTGRKYK